MQKKKWLRGHKISPKKLAKLRAKLYRDLRKEAFDAHFECVDCGQHQRLQVHHLAYDPANFFNRAWYVILCPKCHTKRHRKP